MQPVRLVLRIVFWTSLIVGAVAFFMRDQLPNAGNLLEDLARNPIQQATDVPPFSLTRAGITYAITPLYTYDIVGLVVSGHDTNAWWDYYHKRWGDNLNIKDLCVVWGQANALSGLYKEFSFKSGSWTCYYKTKSTAAYQAFSNGHFSNNHLLVDSDKAARVLRSIRRGDQVRIKGYLATYAHDGVFSRGTSVTRTDTGNGACETIYVKEVEVLQPGNPLWRDVFTFAFAVFFSVLALRIIIFFWQANRPPSFRASA